jgi:hypothetical protein
MRSKQLQTDKLRVAMTVLRDQLDGAVTGQNFLTAQVNAKMN